MPCVDRCSAFGCAANLRGRGTVEDGADLSDGANHSGHNGPSQIGMLEGEIARLGAENEALRAQLQNVGLELLEQRRHDLTPGFAHELNARLTQMFGTPDRVAARTSVHRRRCRS